MSLPAVIQQIVEVIGHTKTMALVQEFGGQELRIPASDASDTWHALSEIIGERAMERLSKAFCEADKIYIAFCAKALRDERNRKMIARYERLIQENHTTRGAVSVLVREFRLNYRQIERIVNAPLPAPTAVETQGQLF